jgi:hypothetical protein
MGRMKELYMEVQEQFNGNIPADFDFDTFLAQKVAEMKQPKEILSNCCSANMSRLVSEDGPSFEDIGICPECHDHCSVN